MKSKTSCRLRRGHGFVREAPSRLSRLKVEITRDAIDIEAFARKVEAGDEADLHGFEIDLFEADSAAGDKFIVNHLCRDSALHLQCLVLTIDTIN